MSKLLTLKGQIKNPRSKVFRKLLMKRRLQGTGLYESSWVDISDYVVKWGSVKKQADSTRVNQFKFSNTNITIDNSYGEFSPSDDENSLWYGYGDQQRTLVKIVVGFLYQNKADNGVWENVAITGGGTWDETYWDSGAYYDNEGTIFSGYISGDLNVTDNMVSIPLVPLSECFRQFTASRLTFYNSSMTASDFITGLRDFQDSFSQYVFRPFFGDTTTNWEITPTTYEYINLNTSTSAELTNKTVWDVIQTLAESENFVPMITSDGRFKFFDRDTSTTTVFDFYGGQSFDSEYGNNIKKISYFGNRFSKYYSRVSVKYREADTATSYEVADSQYRVSADSGPWTLGERTLQVNNVWIPTSTVASVMATDLFNEYSALRKEIEFSASLVPNLEIFDSINITYDQSPVSGNSLWDVYNWGDTTAAIEAQDLLWDASPTDSIKLLNEEFRLISIDINLDTCETKFTGRE